ncbi:hypothetical protein F5Y05DRAFT_204050 [Hypoxylon sp. FL0543]|nr:hypothetical protein F5Y05DRAFT_204050 [Hypoxylon sp. FL0543]
MVEVVDVASKVWKEVFMDGPYSSFAMVDAIAAHLGLSYEDILRNPANLKAFDPNSVTKENLSKPPFSLTWSSLTGRCTSFALKAATLLDTRYPNIFRFQYFDVGRHRVARCANTGILIDSSSKVGAVALGESEDWITIQGIEGRWMYVDGVSTYERSARHGRKRASPITPERAIRTCLREIAKEATLVCVFRSLDIGETPEIWTRRLRGMVKWNIAAKCLELTPDLTNRDKRVVISFSHRGTQETAEKCILIVAEFIKTSGDLRQWRADRTDKIHNRLWDTAVNLWGYPTQIL